MIKRIFYTTLVFIALTMTITLTASAQEYIVKMKDNGVMLFSSDVEPLYTPQNLYVTDEETAKELLESGMAERISPNHTVTLFSNAYQTELNNCPSLSTVNVTTSWNYETFGNEVKVGVIDSGCFKHSDITDNLLQGKNYTTVLDESDTTDTAVDGHGTHVSGIIATTANGIGTVGVAPKAKIVPLKCFPFAKDSDAAAVTAALYDAVDTFGCDVVNMSFGLTEDNEIFREAINYAHSKGVIMIAAVGNYGANTADKYKGKDNYAYAIQYPAGYDCVIGVAAVDKDNIVWNKSQKTPTVITLAAPGVDVNSLARQEDDPTTSENEGLVLNSGTSMASPHVAGAVALALSLDPTITPTEMKTLLINSTHDATGTDKQYAGAGVLDIDLMVQNLLNGRDAYTSPLTETENGLSSTVFDLSGNGISASAIWYDKDSGSVTENPFTVSADGNVELTTPLTSARLFVWNSLNGMIPLTQAR